MTTLSTSLSITADTGTRVHGHRLADDQTILDQLSDVLSRVGVGDLIVFVGIKPNLVSTALEHGRRQALLKTQRTNRGKMESLTNGFSEKKVIIKSVMFHFVYWHRHSLAMSKLKYTICRAQAQRENTKYWFGSALGSPGMETYLIVSRNQVDNIGKRVHRNRGAD